jgi:hypothetical protein
LPAYESASWIERIYAAEPGLFERVARGELSPQKCDSQELLIRRSSLFAIWLCCADLAASVSRYFATLGQRSLTVI